MVVVTCPPDLNLKQGGSSRSVLSAAGQELQDDLKEKYPEKVEFGTVAEGTHCKKGMAKFKMVFAVPLPHWHAKEVDNKQVSVTCVSNLRVLQLKTFPGNRTFPHRSYLR